MRHMLGNLSPNYFERTKRYMMLRASRQGTDLTVSGTPPLSLTNSLGKPLKAWAVEVSPYQEGTGEPSPQNIRPIHGTDKINLYCGSPNIWDEEWEAGTLSSGNPTPSNAVIRSRNFCECAGGQTYYGVCNGYTNEYYMRIWWYDADQTYLSGNWIAGTTVTAPDNAKYFKISTNTSTYVYGSTYNNDISINYPATITDYNPHRGGITFITLPSTVYTGTIGSEGGESRWGEVDLGTLNWTYVSAYSFFTAYNDQYKSVGTGTVPNIMCECYKPASMNQIYGAEDKLIGCGTSGNYAGRFVIKDTDYTNADSFKASLAGQKLVFELATPAEFAVTAPTIPTPTGTATTWATAEDGVVDSMEVTYVGKA